MVRDSINGYFERTVKIIPIAGIVLLFASMWYASKEFVSKDQYESDRELLIQELREIKSDIKDILRRQK